MLATRQVGRCNRARAHSYWQASLLARAGIAPSTTMTPTDHHASFDVAQARNGTGPFESTRWSLVTICGSFGIIFGPLSDAPTLYTTAVLWNLVV